MDLYHRDTDNCTTCRCVGLMRRVFRSDSEGLKVERKEENLSYDCLLAFRPMVSEGEGKVF